MASFKVVMVSGREDMPTWVPETFEKEGVDFAHIECATKQDLARAAGDADVVWVFGGSKILNAENMDAIPRCGGIIRSGSGTDNIAVEAATARGIVVANVPQASAEEVSDHAIGLLFAVVRQISRQDRYVRKGEWSVRNGYPLWQIRDKTAGVIGFGHIARSLIRKIRGFDHTVLVYDPHVSEDVIAEHNAQAVSLDELMERSDWVTVHCPWLPETERMIGEHELRLMKSTAVLVNTARGQIIDEAALIRALEEGVIAGAGLDVFEQEPIASGNPLLNMDNVVVTPHIAGYSPVYDDYCWQLSIEAALAFAKGRWPYSHVNPDVKPRWHLIR